MAWDFFSLFGLGPQQVPPVDPTRTPVSSYGVNDTGRTYPIAPNPTYANNTTLDKKGKPAFAPPAWAYPGSGATAGTGGSSSPFGGFLGALLAGLTGKNPVAGGYEAALRERPKDIQALVSMTRNGAQFKE
jgi:hypothetical protein